MTIGTYGICYSIASYVNIVNEKANYTKECAVEEFPLLLSGT